MRTCAFLFFAVFAACRPFGTDPGDEAGQADVDLDEEAPKKKKSSSAEAPAAPPAGPATTTNPTMPGPTCPGALFCDDFEVSPNDTKLWTGFSPISGDTMELAAPSANPAGVRSLFIHATASNAVPHSALRRDLGTFGHVELDFQLQVPPSFGPSGEHTNLAHLDFAGDQVVVVIVGEGNRVGLSVKDLMRPDFQGVSTGLVKTGIWHSVKLIVDLPTDQVHLEIDNGATKIDDMLATPFSGPPTASLVLGPDYKKSTAELDLRYDDVRVDAN